MRIGLAVAALVLVLDQATKALALSMLAGRPPVEVTGFFNLVLVWNRGVSFGMLQGLGEMGPWLLSAFGVAVCLALLVWLGREDGSQDDGERALAARFRALRALLEAQLDGVQVLAVGQVEVRVLVVGRSRCGELAGVDTVAVET